MQTAAEEIKMPRASRNPAFQTAVRLLNKGDFDQARLRLLAHLNRRPEDLGSWALLAHLTQEPEEELRCVREILHRKPDSTWARRRLEQLLLEPEVFCASLAIHRRPPDNGGQAFHVPARRRRRLPEGIQPVPATPRPRPQPDWTRFSNRPFRALPLPFSEGFAPAKPSKRPLQIALGLFDAILTAFLICAVFFLVVPRLFGSNLLIVLSQSMEPVVPMGSIAISRPVPDLQQIQVGDVITFQTKDPLAPSSFITHRVIEIVETPGGTLFRTKGDAAEEPDTGLVHPTQLMGRIWFSIPWVGFVLAFMQTRVGYLLLVGLPALLLIAGEIRTILRVFREDESAPMKGLPQAAYGGAA
ncbi:MAG TPA: signal peptidase I [Chloroflexi bacterium]|nr:signal peptidase I [Chloroflexota bacterium]